MVLVNADPVIENYKFLLLELQQQLKRISLYLQSQDVKVALTIVDHNDYLINMTTVVKNHCIKAMVGNKNQNKVMTFRNLYDITHSVSNIGSSIVDLLRYTKKDELEVIRDDPFTQKILSQVIKSVKLLSNIFDDTTVGLGHELAEQAEQLQSKMQKYNEHLAQYDNALELFHVFSMFSNMCNQLLHLSEYVLSAEQNKVVTIRQFRALKAALKKAGGEALAEEAIYDRVGETKSGCSIVAVAADKTSVDYMAIFKEGKKEKIKEEKQQFETWNKLFPGVAPRILSYKKKGRSAGILVEYLKGKTFEQIILSRNHSAQDIALEALCNTMAELWQSTKKIECGVEAQYVEQIRKRLPSVFRVHSEYQQKKTKLGNLIIPGLNKLLDKCAEVEASIITPFSVFTHGDFNIDNIIFDEETGQIRFIDLHRSHDTDYLLDVSVFMVSNYRMKVSDPVIRKCINRAMLHFYNWASSFAKQQNDHMFEVRLALGLARSFITSTRFTMDEVHADKMFMRGRYLLEKIANTPESQLANFKISDGLFYG